MIRVSKTSKARENKRALIASALVLLLCFAALIGTTAAWFTSTASNTGNRIQAGTLKIQLLMDKDLSGEYADISNGTGDIFSTNTVATNSNKTLWEPGKTQWVALAVHNEGSLQAKYNIVLDVVDEGLLNQNGKSSLEYVLLDGKKAEDITGVTSWEDIQTLAGMTAADVQAGRIVAAQNGELEQKGATGAADYDYFVLAVHMKETAGNEYQDQAAVIDVNVVATQLAAELDGFAVNTYDKDALLPLVPDRVDGWGLSNQTRATDGTTTKEMKITVVKIESAEEELGETTIPQAAVESVLNELLSELPTPPEGKLIEDTLILTVNVETKDVTTESMKLDITMDGTAARTQRDEGAPATEAEVIQQAAQPVTELAAPVSVDLSIPRNLRDVNVDHTHGTTTTAMTRVYSKTDLGDGKFFYDPDTGELVLMTTKFSEFNITYNMTIVARIGDKGYSTFEAALADYDGTTPITLVENVDYEGTIINKNVVIDANQKNFVATVAESATINIQNANKATLIASEDKTVTVNEGTCKELNFKGTGSVAINGGTFTKVSIAEKITNASITNGVFSELIIEKNTVVVSITGGKFAALTAVADAKITVTGGTFKNDPSKYCDDNHYAEKITIEGDYKGWYQVKQFGDNIVARVDNNGTTTVWSAEQYVTNGKTLKLVKNATNNAATAALQGYTSGGADYPLLNTNWIFDLNGKTLDANTDEQQFAHDFTLYFGEWNGGSGETITFIDSSADGTGKVINSCTDKADTSVAVSTSCNFTVGSNTANPTYIFNGGTYEALKYAFFMKEGNVTINKGTFNAPYAIYARADDYGTTSNTNLTITDGTFNGKIKLDQTSGSPTASDDICHVIISGGTFNDVFEVSAATDLKISGGSFKDASLIQYVVAGKIMVQEGDYYVVKDASAAPDVYTATISTTNSTEYFVAEGGANIAMTTAVPVATVTLQEDSTAAARTLNMGETLTVVSNGYAYTEPVGAAGLEFVVTDVSEGVKKYEAVEPPVATVNGVKYYTVNEAFKAITRGGTMILGRDINLGNSYKDIDAFTLDLNGHTITSSAAYTLRHTTKSGTATLIIKDTSEAKTGAIVNTKSNTISGGRALYLYQTKPVQIDSGTFKSAVGAAVENYNQSTLTINGGTFISQNGSEAVVNRYNASVTTIINGGTYSNDIGTQIAGDTRMSLGAGKSVVKNEDDTWTVK